MEDTFQDVLTRSVVDCVHSSELEEALKGNQKLRIYWGIDPTGPMVHLGHTIPLRKLAAFQKLGHKVIFLIGDFTAMIGDPTDREQMRQPLTREQVLENAKDYLNQAKKIIPIDDPKNPVEVRFNSEWHGKENKQDFLEHAYLLTVQQLLERDMFVKRIENGQPISLSEFTYPYLQGYDAVMLDADVQIGATDQLFNMLMGRDLRKKMKNKNHIVMTLPLIPGTDGRKMSKSYGNTINVDDQPNDIFGKLMSITDELIIPYFEHVTSIPLNEINALKQKVTTDPKATKMRLAFQIVSDLYDESTATKAKENFESIFVNKDMPDVIEERVVKFPIAIIEALVTTGLCSSKTEASRLIEQGGVSFEKEKITDSAFTIELEGILQVGKRRFIKLRRG